jgi:DsbE subfamily thiol:disulfide oxidoreductase
VRRPVVLGVALGLGALAVVLVVAAWPSPDDQAGPVAMSTPLPRMTGESLDGDAIDTDELRGDVAVINVWATWCDPCRREQPMLVSLSEAYSERGVRFMGLNYQDDVEAARQFVKEFGVPYPSLVDERGAWADDLGFPYLPDTYVVDPGGTIRWAIYGETSAEELSGLIDQVLADPAGEA